RWAVPARTDPGRTAQPDPRPAQDQRPARRQPGALPARTRRTQGVRTVTRPETAMTGHAPARGSQRDTARHRNAPAAARLAAGVLLALGLAGCSIIGGGNDRERSTIYAPAPRVQIDPSAPVAADWQLSISPPVG